MSGRSKHILTLALNKQLAERKHLFNQNKTKIIVSHDNLDRDFSPLPDKRQKKNEKYDVTKKAEINVQNQILITELIDGILTSVVDISESKKQIESQKPKSIVHIISNIIVNNSDTRSNEYPGSFIKELLDIIIDLAVKVVEKSKQTLYTKNGSLRKRKKFDTTLAYRKKQKRVQKINRHNECKTYGLGCKQKCTTKIDTARQSNIHSEFWSLNSEEQRQFIFSTVKNVAKKRKTLDDNNSRRQNIVIYYLKDSNGLDCRVCKKFFLGTLGYSIHNNRIIRDVFRKTPSDKLVVMPLKKGHPSEKKIDREIVVNHINSFNPTISHYWREHAPNRKYLPSDINITMMHKDFLKKHPENIVSYELYRKQISEMNISFAVLGHEECWQCESFLRHSKSLNHDKNEISAECLDCTNWKNHNENAISAREEYKMDVSIGAGDKKLFYSVDLQKVVMLPRCDMFKEVIFTPRIICFNESFVPLAKQSRIKKPVAVIWHEGVTGRSKCDIITTFYKFLLLNRDALEITITHQVEKFLKQKGKVLDFEDTRAA